MHGYTKVVHEEVDLIKRDDFKDIGPSPLCPGCRRIIRVLPAQSHSELSRSRVEAGLIRIGYARIRQEAIDGHVNVHLAGSIATFTQ